VRSNEITKTVNTYCEQVGRKGKDYNYGDKGYLEKPRMYVSVSVRITVRSKILHILWNAFFSLCQENSYLPGNTPLKKDSQAKAHFTWLLPLAITTEEILKISWK
jgi:hypothetical protein